MAHISRRISNEKKKWDNRDNEIYNFMEQNPNTEEK